MAFAGASLSGGTSSNASRRRPSLESNKQTLTLASNAALLSSRALLPPDRDTTTQLQLLDALTQEVRREQEPPQLTGFTSTPLNATTQYASSHNAASSSAQIAVAYSNSTANSQKHHTFLYQDANQQLMFARDALSKEASPDRIDLSAGQLESCPIFENEMYLRILLLSQNRIQFIQPVRVLRNLIVLDLTENRLKDLSPLADMPALRVLLVGGNRLQSLEGIQGCPCLDVLNASGNRLSTIEPLRQLSQLRDLNLANNNIHDLSVMEQLPCLTNVNASNNAIAQLPNLQSNPSLETLYLSRNKIEGAGSLDECKTLLELALDENPVVQTEHYREKRILALPSLRLLDGKRISPDMRRMAGITLRRIQEKADQAARAEQQREQRETAINACKTAWFSILRPRKRRLGRLFQDAMLTLAPLVETQPKPQRQLALTEIQGLQIVQYGYPRDILDGSIGTSTAQSITQLHLLYYPARLLNAQWSRVARRLPNVTSIRLQHCDCRHLVELNGLAAFKRLTTLNLAAEPLAQEMPQWRLYAIHRIATLQTIDGQPITVTQRMEAHRCFGPLTIIMNQLPAMTLAGRRHHDLPVDESALPAARVVSLC
ncbi:uncharacterized protein MONBRDRAFT_26670 [Monosiga brevicollis MX1]|uniref:Uncharacterized protein n=1 Tax=Monosiga brevicollis TaxID=81824 RepID=A9V314_MONBE|nr:uncharacterized protein MONBRDRAFT_26670 [Monosiga brevicollis MX1]EDQ87983.1 predicted protein [Monosiga brevicollis MX1]|eukprot:XP_001747059.1 hypothetical protein [Monosiga brevicollis MX1]